MEAIVLVGFGVVLGAVVGVLVMLMRSSKSGDVNTELQSELIIARKNLEDASRAAAEHKQDAEQQRAKVVEQGEELARLETRFEDTQSRFEFMESENDSLKTDVERWRDQAGKNDAIRLELQAKLDASNKRLAEQTDIEATLKAQFEVMANDAITKNNDVFLKNADEKIGAMLTQAKTDFSHNKDAVQELVKPLSDELKRIEEARNKSQGSLTTQIATLVENNSALAEETRNLTTALKRPEVRGSWGEMQLRRVVELAGMSNYCDYEEQVSVTADDGSRDRPDMIVRMPNERTIVIDAKTPMDAYLTAIESDKREERESAIERHAQQVKARAEGLSKKSYQDIFQRSPDFVVMFLPGEFLLQPALEKDRGLLDWAMQRNVVIATPNTLMALLKAVAMGWREAQIEEEASKVAAMGQELHDRLYTFGTHMEKMRGSLNQTVQHFNRGVGSLESRVFTSARRFKDYGISSSNELPSISEIEQNVRELRALPEASVAGDD